MIRKLFFLFLFVVASIAKQSNAQQNKIDSIKILIKKDKEDTNKVNHLCKVSAEYINIGSYDTSLYYSNTTLLLASKLNFKKGISNAYNNIGVVYMNQGNFPKALDFYYKALRISEELGNKKFTILNLGNIGNIYYYQSNYSKALEYFFRALKMSEEIGDKQIIAKHFAHIGLIYDEQGNYAMALNYDLKALKISEELGDKEGITQHFANIGLIYDELGNYQKALDYYFKSLQLAKELGNKNIIASNLDNIGSLYTSEKKYKEAEKCLLQALAIADSINDLFVVKDVNEQLSSLYTRIGNDKKALEYYKKYTLAKDSIFNEGKNKEITRKEMNYEFEKKEAITKAQHDKELAVSEAEKKKQEVITWAVIGGLIIVIVFTGFIFRSLRITNKQKHIIEIQKAQVDEHQKEIIASITYAKRLQEAILPPLDFVKRYLPNSFILYKPKDIVAGDFYWMEVIENTVFIAAADCTGHGVPGALVSVVCSNALNRTVKEFKLKDTGKILDKVTELVLETFEKSDKDVKDGMDISLLAINQNTKQIQWSGANNPLWYVQNEKLIELAPDKQPIGKHDNRKPFTTHDINYQNHISIYLFTDGYADQFGGLKGKKFKYKQLEEKILQISGKSLTEQHDLLDKTFDAWKGNLEQIDDVCVIGITI